LFDITDLNQLIEINQLRSIHCMACPDHPLFCVFHSDWQLIVAREVVRRTKHDAWHRHVGSPFSISA